MELSIWIVVLAVLTAALVVYLLTKASQEKKLAAMAERSRNLESDKLEREETLAATRQQVEDLRRENEALKLKQVQIHSELSHSEKRLAEHKEEVEQLQEKLGKDFEILANKILEEKSSKFTDKNKEHLAQILNPLQEKIQRFEKKVEETHKESLVKQSALREQIKGLKELNQQMSKDAINLTKALKGDSKKQGDWGELQLETILDKAGLQKDLHYSTQGGFRDEAGNLKKPDFIIHLPDQKQLIIDSKVSLTAYEKYFSAEDEMEETSALKEHLVSVQKHIKDLGSKDYSGLYEINSPDYVMMFIPIEPALMVALQAEPDLYLEALDKNVVLVSTSTLLATLSTVASIWKQEDQKKNVLEIARQAGALYDKFEGLVQDLLKVGKQINASQDSYRAAMNKLTEGRGNLISRVENLKSLGAKTKKALPDNLLERSKEELN